MLVVKKDRLKTAMKIRFKSKDYAYDGRFDVCLEDEDKKEEDGCRLIRLISRAEYTAR